MQGGVKNYWGNQKMVNAPLKWRSGPQHPSTELAYITKKEKDLLVKKDLHGSLKGGVNKGPSGIVSLNGFGSTDPDQNVSGSQISAAETGNFSGFSGTGGGSGPELPPGVTRKPSKTAQDFRAAAINAGAGQRVNPGFFDSRTTLSPNERLLAKTYRNRRNAKGELVNRFAKKAYRNTGQGGLRGFLTSGGFFGNLLRGVGQKFGWGKKYNEPTYDMSEDNDLGLYTDSFRENPDYYNDLDNEMALSTKGSLPNNNILPEYDVEYNVNTEPYFLPNTNIEPQDDLMTYDEHYAQGGRAGYQDGELVGQETDFIQGPHGGEEFQETVVEGEEQPSREQLEALAMEIFQLPLEELDDEQLLVVYQEAMQGQPMEEAVQEEDVQFAANGGRMGYLFGGDIEQQTDFLEGPQGDEKFSETMMASSPSREDGLNELSLQLFGKELHLLTEEEMDILNDEADRLTGKFSGAEGGLASIL